METVVGYVEELDEIPTKEVFLDQYFGKKPFIVRNQNHTIGYDSELLSYTSMMKVLEEDPDRDQVIRVEKRHTQHGNFGNGVYEHMKLSQALEMIMKMKSEEYYITTEDRSEDILAEELYSESLLPFQHILPEIPLLEGAWIKRNQWMGNQGQREGNNSRLHHDYDDNIYVVLEGEKKFLLFPPQFALVLYTYGKIEQCTPDGEVIYEVDDDDFEALVEGKKRKIEKEPPHFCQVDLRHPDYDRFPFLKLLKPIEVKLAKNDLFYLPLGWFHDVYSYGNYHHALSFWFNFADPAE